MLLPPASVGASKLRAVLNDNTPLLALMLKAAASAPPAMLKVVAGPLGSVAVTVVTAMLFSGTLRLALAAPPLLVMVGPWNGVTSA